jgi:hypothetical protein
MKIFRLVLAFILVIQIPSAFAHERHVYEINGKSYLIVIGSLNEPVNTGDKSGIDFRVKLADPSDPGNSSSAEAQNVEGLEKTLRAEVQVSGEANPLDLKTVYKKPGEYAAYFYPQEPVAYAYRIFGTIDGVNFDQTYHCNIMGHVMQGSDDTTVRVVSPGVKETLVAGSFGCPKDRELISFPKPSNSSNPWQALTTIAIILSVVALARSRKA